MKKWFRNWFKSDKKIQIQKQENEIKKNPNPKI